MLHRALSFLCSSRRPSPVVFVLIGAAHLIGGEGLVQLLQGKGYEVSQL